jgi:hypothetical protein
MDVSNEETITKLDLPVGQCRQINAIQQKRGNIYGTAGEVDLINIKISRHVTKSNRYLYFPN